MLLSRVSLSSLACSAGTSRPNSTILAPWRSPGSKAATHLLHPQNSHSAFTKAARPQRAVLLQAVKQAGSEEGSLNAEALQLIADLSRAVDAQVSGIVSANVQAGQAAEPSSTSPLRSRVLQSIARVSQGLLERETEVRLLLLAALCGEHLLLLGPPGTAKSELARRLNDLVGGAYFERLLTRFSVPEELFGPLSMRGLENDEYVRQTAGYLPTAEVAFIDEIFKANSAILNALLTLLNERLFDNGNMRSPVPLLTLVGASNELPESEELDALFDRFLLRRSVSRVSNANVGTLARLAAGRSSSSVAAAAGAAASTSDAQGLAFEDFKTAAEKAYQAVDVPESVVDLLVELRNWLQDKCEPPVVVSDRRFMKAVQFLQVVAYSDGREQVGEYDCLLLEHVFGNRPDDSVKVRTKVLDLIASDPGIQQTELVLLGLFGRAVRLLSSSASASPEELKEASQEAEALVGMLSERHQALCVELEAPAGGFPSLRSCVWQAAGPAQAAVQALTPQVTENRKRVTELLREAETLRACLSRALNTKDVLPGMVEKLLPKRAKQYAKGIAAAAAPSAPNTAAGAGQLAGAAA